MGDTFYTYREMKRPTRMQKYNNQGTGQNLHKQHQQSTSHSYMRYRNNTKPSKRKNPLRNCLETWCSILRSINQWNSQCPDRSSEEITYMVHELILQNSSLSVNQIEDVIYSNSDKPFRFGNGREVKICNQVLKICNHSSKLWTS